MSKNNISVTVITPKTFNVKHKNFDYKKTFKILRYTENKLLKIPHILKLFFIEYLKTDKLILIPTGLLPFTISGILAKIFRLKSIAIFHGHELSMGNPLINYISNYSVKNFNKVIAVSDFSGKILNDVINKNKIEIIHNGIDISRFKNFKSTSEKPLNEKLSLITVGSLSRRKGQHNVIKALPEIRKCFLM